MGRLFLIDLEGKKFTCKHCQAHLAHFDDIISKSFHGRHGRAYLFDKVVNVTFGEKEERLMSTGIHKGIHIVVDIFCMGCGSLLGWKYEQTAEKESQKYIGKFVLDRFQLLGPDGSKYSITQDLVTDMTLDTDIERWDMRGQMRRGNRPYHPQDRLPGWL